MSSETIGARGRGRVDWRRAEFVLTLLAFLGFLTLPIRITTIYGGCPAHPLFVHVPVVLIPSTSVPLACTVLFGPLDFQPDSRVDTLGAILQSPGAHRRDRQGPGVARRAAGAARVAERGCFE